MLLCLSVVLLLLPCLSASLERLFMSNFSTFYSITELGRGDNKVTCTHADVTPHSCMCI